ncbi:MAG: prolyl oligopeptidase family serine peptidase [Anaerolineae bacterium]|nr:prolyl oligopeptidase family serine peptidase [Anaerolineae bacterium]
MAQSNHIFTTTLTKQASLPYLVYLPPEYETREHWPLILFLHGRGERGNDLEILKRTGLPSNIEAGQDFPFIIVSPQCPATSYWIEQIEALNALLDYICDQYPVDQDRIYVTGLSMGGSGTWHLAGTYTERFAAIAPICGTGYKWYAEERINDLPAWVFHGDADPVVPVEYSKRMVEALQDRGAEVRLTIYPGVDHDAWTRTYNNPELYEWFLEHSRNRS